jgi:hypothetical protein
VAVEVAHLSHPELEELEVLAVVVAPQPILVLLALQGRVTLVAVLVRGKLVLTIHRAVEVALVLLG